MNMYRRFRPATSVAKKLSYEAFSSIIHHSKLESILIGECGSHSNTQWFRRQAFTIGKLKLGENNLQQKTHGQRLLMQSNYHRSLNINFSDVLGFCTYTHSCKHFRVTLQLPLVGSPKKHIQTLSLHNKLTYAPKGWSRYSFCTEACVEKH